VRGRKPKPTAVHKLEDSLRPGRHAERELEPKAPGELAEAPAWFTENQKIGWAYAIANAPAGVLGRIDRSVLAVWVVAEDLHRQAVEKVTGPGGGLIVRSPSKGEPMQNPWLAIVNKQAQILIKAASELGFSPASRPRLVGGPSRGDDNEFEGLGDPDSVGAALN
jgi:P27 family predicted phage terminase small subunit